MAEEKESLTDAIAATSTQTTQSNPSENNANNVIISSSDADGDQNDEFSERDRVKIIAPSEYANRTGHIAKIKNDDGFIEVELDYVLNDAKGYAILESEEDRERIVIKNPAKQLEKYEFMRADRYHFSTDLRAESFLGVSGVATFILGFAISDLLGIDKESWFNESLFYAYLISQSLTVGLGWFCVLILTFTGLKIKRVSAQNNLKELECVHDDALSYYWYKSKHWKPWWMFGRDASPVEWAMLQTGKIMLVFFGMYILSIVLFVVDQLNEEWYISLISCLLMVIPSLFALHMIVCREMHSFA